LAGRLESWLSNTTTMDSCLPDEKALTWPALSLAKLGVGAAPGVAAVAAVAVPAIAAVRDIATPAAPVRVHHRAVCMRDLLLRGITDMKVDVHYDHWVPTTAQGLFKLVRASWFC
jgi:hypothetical protein